MHKTLGYLLTWTTYGTWLQGDENGYVRDGVTFEENASLADANRGQLKKDPVRLTYAQRKTIENAIHKKAAELRQQIYALAVCSDHVHIVIDYTTKDIGIIVRHYKIAALKAIKDAGFAGPLWTKGFDKRFCFDQLSLRRRINYVNRH